jgi:predicted ribosome quality control (RQC) complex YloA/Tae2 family protein
VSNAIRYDSLLVRELARELHHTLVGTRVEGVWLDRERLRFTLTTRPRRRGEDAPSLLWQLHPSSGHLTPAQGHGSGARVQLATPSFIRRVTAPPDERVIMLELQVAADAPAGMPRQVIIELVTNQWNALAVAADGRITAVLRERQTRDRTLKPGAAYVPPRPSDRAGADGPLSADVWLARLQDVPPGERLAALPRFAAYTSPALAPDILGDADVRDDRDALLRSLARYNGLVHGGPLRAVLLQHETGWQPHAAPVAAGEEAFDSLLAAFAESAHRAAAAPLGGVTVEEALDAVARQMEAVQRRIERLREEQAGASAEAADLRMQADLLLSHLHAVRRGSTNVVLTGFDGSDVAIPLDPARSPSDNAAALYDSARKRERAAARVPDLLRRAEGEMEALEQLAGRIREGTADADELARLHRAQPATGRDAPPPLPYREYRTTRGLEVRVGRGSKSNDELTFRHSSPNDVWLHARDVAGAHVILRWPRADANPPAADIAEAAVLAALHSKARTSGTVPVDWTRRKHVRKPRKAGPGLVIPERVRTVFVEPDPALEERLRA